MFPPFEPYTPEPYTPPPSPQDSLHEPPAYDDVDEVSVSSTVHRSRSPSNHCSRRGRYYRGRNGQLPPFPQNVIATPSFSTLRSTATQPTATPPMTTTTTYPPGVTSIPPRQSSLCEIVSHCWLSESTRSIGGTYRTTPSILLQILNWRCPPADPRIIPNPVPYCDEPDIFHYPAYRTSETMLINTSHRSARVALGPVGGVHPLAVLSGGGSGFTLYVHAYRELYTRRCYFYLHSKTRRPLRLTDEIAFSGELTGTWELVSKWYDGWWWRLELHHMYTTDVVHVRAFRDQVEF
uniref:Uncharacterized protein n=1 Tax=Mycena chlorophos TaxID=658473 RepID=A0ABQ0LB83_MYCCL|nr:predicted protein [Mycena chlorophos]